MFTTKKNLILLALVVLCLAIVGCQNAEKQAIVPSGFLSVADFSSDDIVVLGTYDQVVARLGEPDYPTDMRYHPKFWDDSSWIRVIGFGYESVEYSRLNDSVQLSFIDLRKTGARLTLQAGDGPRMIIDSNTLCDDFYRYINTYVDTSYDINSWPDEEKLTFDPHYQTDGLYFALGFPTDTTDPMNSPLIMPVFTRHDRRLWYIEFPPLDMRGIFRDIKSNRESYRRSFGCLP